jgi:type I restriction-modification system DNA methylase subunit
MQWIAPSQKDTTTDTPEKRLWDAADPFRANSGLKPQEYSAPVRHGGKVNSYYDDPHDATGRFELILANPPFNVNAVSKEQLKDSVGPGRRLPFGLPRTDNANCLWIQLFHSALNEKGRAGLRLVKVPNPRIISENAWSPFIQD